MTRGRPATSAIGLARWLRLLGLTIAATALFTSPAGANSLQVSVSRGVPFPARTLHLTVLAGPPLTAANVHVSENRSPVPGVRVTAVPQATVGRSGLVMVIDTDSSMGGPVMAHAMVAARALAARRTPEQKLGVVISGGKGKVALPLTNKPPAIRRALVHGPAVGGTANLLNAIALAIKQFRDAKIANRAVIVLTDDIDPIPGTPLGSIEALARSAHVPIFVVGVRDSAYTPWSMAELARSTGGLFLKATPSQVKGIFTRIETGLTRRYVVHYRSTAPLGTKVRFTVRVDGVAGSYSGTYATPSLPPVVPQHSFWSSSLALVLATVACALLLGVLAVLLLSYFLGTRSVTTRVGEFIPAPAAPPVPRSGGAASVALGRTERALTTREWWPGFVESVEIAHMGHSPVELVYLAAIGSCFAFAALFLVSGSLLVGILGLPLGPLFLRAALNFNLRRQRTKFADQLPTHLEEVAGAMRSGRSIVEALGVVSQSAEEPTRGEFTRALADERLGRPLEETLRPIAARMESDAMEQFAVVAAMHRQTGSSVAEVLDTLAEGARDRAELKRELRALTAQGRLARWILTAMPPVMLLLFYLINPSYERPMFHTAGGLIALGLGATLVVVGSLIMKRIIEIEV